jgi:hypothetical protein
VLDINYGEGNIMKRSLTEVRFSELNWVAIRSCVDKVFADDAEWFNRMCGIRTQRESSQFPSRSAKH